MPKIDAQKRKPDEDAAGNDSKKPKVVNIDDDDDVQIVSVKGPQTTNTNTNTNVTTTSTPSSSTTKQPCQYGARCYRKNPQHLKEFSHPGDT